MATWIGSCICKNQHHHIFITKNINFLTLLNIIHKSKCILKLRQQTNSKRKNQIQLGRRFYFKNATKIVKVQVQYFIVPIMLISCISENKIKGKTSIFNRKTKKGKPVGDVDQNYASKHFYFVIYINASSSFTFTLAFITEYL